MSNLYYYTKESKTKTILEIIIIISNYKKVLYYL